MKLWSKAAVAQQWMAILSWHEGERVPTEPLELWFPPPKEPVRLRR